MKYQITASIVAYRSDPAELLEAVKSFLNTGFENKQLIIIDHSETDDLKRYVSSLGAVSYYHHPENKGFGAGHNIAIGKLLHESPYHLVLNPDVSFGPSVLPVLVQYLDAHPDTAQIMPKVVDGNGDLQYLAKLIPHPADLIFKRFLPKSIAAGRMHRFQLKFTDYNHIMNVPYLSGCFMLLRTAALQKTGLFDERFFMYPEDMDLTRRLHEHYKTIYYPFVEIVHRHEASSYKNFRMFRIHLYNLVRYFNKWGWFIDSKRKQINRKVLQDLNYSDHRYSG